MEKKYRIFRFGEDIEGYNKPVLNEREIRAATGILFLIMFISVLTVLFKGDFVLLKFAITFFLSDLLIRIFINPRFSPFLIIGRLIVRQQVPEYVGAAQKKFAWIIGAVVAIPMFILQIVVNSYSPVTGIMCFICLIFLFFESAFGICIGCRAYSLFYKEKGQYCPGETCNVTIKHDIQKTSTAQILIVIGFISYMILTIQLFKSDFREKPSYLFEASTVTKMR